MDDSISRQAAIDAMQKAVKNIDSMNKADIVAVISNLPSAQQWIPCSERLPEKHGEMYLVTISDGAVYSTTLQWDINRKRWYLSFLNNGEILIDYIDDVIAWRELPEPYKGEQE